MLGALCLHSSPWFKSYNLGMRRKFTYRYPAVKLTSNLQSLWTIVVNSTEFVMNSDHCMALMNSFSVVLQAVHCPAILYLALQMTPQIGVQICSQYC